MILCFWLESSQDGMMSPSHTGRKSTLSRKSNLIQIERIRTPLDDRFGIIQLGICVPRYTHRCRIMDGDSLLQWFEKVGWGLPGNRP